ncbi:hypothetical protein P9112_005854 [Eukaryota sp. TZLM1-RC]
MIASYLEWLPYVVCSCNLDVLNISPPLLSLLGARQLDAKNLAEMFTSNSSLKELSNLMDVLGKVRSDVDLDQFKDQTFLLSVDNKTYIEIKAVELLPDNTFILMATDVSFYQHKIQFLKKRANQLSKALMLSSKVTHTIHDQRTTQQNNTS